MTKKQILFSILLGLLILGVGVGFLKYRAHKRQEALAAPNLNPPPNPITKKEDLQKFLEQEGQKGLKKRNAQVLIGVYEKMLVQFPESVDLKKKLASAYEDTEEHDKAQKLLESLPK